MARLHDSGGNLLGGLDSSSGQRALLPIPASVPQTRLNSPFGAEETLLGLKCSYGTYAYASDHDLQIGSRHSLHLKGCHSPVEEPDERHHCHVCGGDYCSTHAERAAHDCSDVILPT